MKHRFAFLLAEFLYLRLESITTHLEAIFNDSDDEAFLFVGKPVNSPQGSQRNESVVFNLAKSESFNGILTFSNTLTPYDGRSILEDYLDHFDKSKIVSIGEEIEGCSSIKLDNFHSIQLTINHLIEHGLSKFMYIGGPLSNHDAKERFEGTLDFLKTKSISLISSFEGNFSYEFGANVVNDLFANNQDLPEAFICANDEMAIGAYHTLLNHGIKVPDDVKIVGFDDNEKGRHIETPLTTINQGFASMVLSGIDIIKHQHKHDLVLPGDLVIRESCGCKSFIKEAKEEYFEKKMIIEKNQQLQQSLMDNLELQARLSYVNNYNELVTQVKELLVHYENFEFHICLFNEKPMSISDPLEFSFPEKMNCLLSLVEGQFYEHIEFNTKDIIPISTKVKSSTRVFYVYPLRVEKVSFGYIVCNISTAHDRRFVSLKDLLNISLNRIELQRELDQYKIELENLSFKDSLTKSYNHRGFHHFAEPHFTECNNIGLTPALLYCDVDYLKLINDSYGHISGDTIIVAASDLLNHYFSTEIVARIGGDEFIVYIKDSSAYNQAILKRDLHDLMNKKNEELNQEYNFSLSFGLCLYDQNKHRNLEDLIREADNLLYETRKSSNHYYTNPKITR
jgi:diguanylate cyclase (GGDEF)-like protein